MTKSRSTWACELKYGKEGKPWKYRYVTLHVSVWVEIIHSANLGKSARSRSTWACELKLFYKALHFGRVGHAPRERVSWNFSHDNSPFHALVTLHMSLWVEIYKSYLYLFTCVVTLHVSVWVEMKTLLIWVNRYSVTLHVSVWVEMFFQLLNPIFCQVTLHVSVWVEIRNKEEKYLVK